MKTLRAKWDEDNPSDTALSFMLGFYILLCRVRVRVKVRARVTVMVR